MRIILCLILILSIIGCTTGPIDPSCDTEFSTDNLNEAQLAALDNLIINNEYISGCVTEELEQLKNFSIEGCPRSKLPTLEFIQWKNVYTSCIAQ